MKDFLKSWTDVSIQSVKKEYHDNYWKNNDIEIEYPVVTKTILGFNPRSVLEVGCGNGHNLLAIKNHDSNVEITGIDVSSVGIEKAKEHHVGEFYPMDARNLLFTDDSFDVVFTVHALEQMKYCLEKVLGEIYRVCSGFVVLFEPFFVQQNIFGKWHIIRSEYAQGIPFFVEDTGFRIIRFEKLSSNNYISKGWNKTGLLIGKKSN
jgi:ubiquinone/menaquinone biosynthesis C-methylase UbiE